MYKVIFIVIFLSSCKIIKIHRMKNCCNDLLFLKNYSSIVDTTGLESTMNNKLSNSCIVNMTEQQIRLCFGQPAVEYSKGKDSIEFDLKYYYFYIDKILVSNKNGKYIISDYILEFFWKKKKLENAKFRRIIYQF
jgi:hypothetical protein